MFFPPPRRQFPPTPVTSPVIPSWQLLPREGKMDEITALKKEASDEQEMPRDAADEDLSQEPSIAEVCLPLLDCMIRWHTIC